MNWKKQLGELKNLSKQENKNEKWLKKPKISAKIIISCIDRVSVAFCRYTGWDMSNNGGDYKTPTAFYLHPKADNNEPWRCLDDQITISIDFENGWLEIIAPSALEQSDLSSRLVLPLSNFSEEELANRLKKIYILYAQGMATDNRPTATLEIDDAPDNVKLGWFYSPNKDQFQMTQIAEEDRATHTYVIGATGTGKTKLLEFFIQQDIENENGFGVIDPHGDLIEDIKGFLACYERHYRAGDIYDRVVLIDPTDTSFTVAFNPLEKLPNVSIAEQVGELVSSFKKIWASSWGVRMEDLLRNSLIALGEAELSLVDLPHFLTDRSFRENVLLQVENPLARDYFNRRFNMLTDRGQLPFIEPVLNKINAFLADPRIRQMFSSSKSSFNLRDIIDHRKMLLIKLDKGKLKGSADLLGSLLMAKIQLAAFSRSDIPQNRRTPFYLYIDEFQNFASESFMIVLSEARKYGLSLIMSHQTLAQIPEELRSLILGNAGIQIYFRVNRKDAQILAKEAFEYSGYNVKTYKFRHPVFWTLGEEWEYKTEELQKLPPRCCYAKHMIEGGLIPLITADIDPAWEILGMEEARYHNYIKKLPIGKNYLISRDNLPLTIPKFQPVFKEPSRGKKSKDTPLPVNFEKEVERLVEQKTANPSGKLSKAEPEEPRKERQHRYLQNLIKHMAEQQGYRAVIEKSTPDGGRVDVGLEQNGRKIAFEITVTSTSEQEIANIEKCLRAGYDQIVLCSSEKRPLEKIKALAFERFEKPEQEKLLFLRPEEVFSYLEKKSSLSGNGERFKGYKVNVHYQPLQEDEQMAKREAVAQVILQSLKRQKD
jgi:hypothetical protein